MTKLNIQVFDSYVTFEVAKGTRTCRRARGATLCDRKINPKETHLAVYKGDPPMRDNYCLNCASLYLIETREKLGDALTAIDDVQNQLEAEVQNICQDT